MSQIQCGVAVTIITVGDSMTKNGVGFHRTFEGRVVYIHPSQQWFAVEYTVGGVALRECFRFDDVGKYVRLKEE